MKSIALKAFLFTFALAGTGGWGLAAPANESAANGFANSPSGATALPTALRPALYRALVKDADQAYAVNSKGCATLPKQQLTACFGSNGPRFTGIDSSVALHLVSYGRGKALSRIRPVQPLIEANQVRYVHGNLSEWWRILPLGFEQGFTLDKRPDGHGELTLTLAASRHANAHNHTLGWGRLRYGKLVVTDADGKVIPASLKSEGDRVLIAVNDAHATYPLTVDPLVWLEQKTTANDGATNDLFGISAAISGTTAIIGARQAVVNGNFNQGAVYVFSESGGVWSETQKLVASDGGVGDTFGWSVALDGTTALIGAPGALGAQGAAYVFTESDGAWSQAQKLTASDGTYNDLFGFSVAIDGATLFAGADQATVNGNSSQGAVYVFADSNGIWTQTQKLTAGDGAASDFFGTAVAASGATALIGAAQIFGPGPGAAYVFTQSGGTWSQAQKLTASDGAGGDTFGWSLALSGTTAFIGSVHATVNGNSWQGAVYVFAESGGTWAQTHKLTESSGATGDVFGWTIALNGSTALIGTPGAAVNGNDNQGVAYEFTDSGGNWAQTRQFSASDGAAGDDFGDAVALSNTTALIGAPFATVHTNSAQGDAYFYGKSDLGLATSAPQTVGQGQTYVSQTIATNNASAASPAVSATITVPAAASFVSATASQGTCSETSGVVTCNFGQINGNAGTATANVTLKATGNVGNTIDNTASVAKATPPLTANAPTTITEGAACPEGYTEYDGTLNPGKRAHSPIYQAPAGKENAILTGPAGFHLYAVFQNTQGRKIYRIPGNEVHRRAPAGYFTWVVTAGDTGGAYTLCLMHP